MGFATATGWALDRQETNVILVSSSKTFQVLGIVGSDCYNTNCFTTMVATAYWRSSYYHRGKYMSESQVLNNLVVEIEYFTKDQ